MSSYYSRADVERIGVDGCLKQLNDLYATNSELFDCVERFGVIVGHVLEQIEKGYDRLNYTNQQIETFERDSQNLLVIDMRAYMITAIREMCANA